MSKAFIFIGSNVEREKNYPAAVEQLVRLGTVHSASPVYDTPPVGEADGPRFFNGAVLLETPLSPRDLRHSLRDIEMQMGRRRDADKDAPRTIDLDLVLYDDDTIHDGELTIPDPLVFERAFMAQALADLDPDYVVPPDGPTLAELACRLGKNVALRVDDAASAVVQEIVHRLKETKRLSNASAMSGGGADAVGERWEWDDDSAGIFPTLPGSFAQIDRARARREIAKAVRSILLNVGEDPSRAGLRKTPERVARAYEELLSGYHVDPTAMINGAVFDADYHDMVVVKDIEFYSMCEHHMLPFFGTAHVAYIPDGRVVGLSKIPRIVEMYARRLQLQEKMTQEIANFLEELLHPRGVAVVVTAQHMCSTMRGVKKSQAKMVTQVLRGEFEKPEVREQLKQHLRED